MQLRKADKGRNHYFKYPPILRTLYRRHSCLERSFVQLQSIVSEFKFSSQRTKKMVSKLKQAVLPKRALWDIGIFKNITLVIPGLLKKLRSLQISYRCYNREMCTIDQQVFSVQTQTHKHGSLCPLTTRQGWPPPQEN